MSKKLSTFKIWINTSGFTGFGTSTPSYSVHAYVATNAAYIGVESGGVFPADINYKNTNRFWSLGIYSNGGFHLIDNTAGVERWAIDLLGRMSVNGGSNGARFTINVNSGADDGVYVVAPSGNTAASFGSNRASTTGLVFYFVCAGSNAGSITHPTTTTTAYNTSSDYRLKTDPTPIHDAWERLKRLRPGQFYFKAECEQGEPNLHEGFLAHEVQEIVPWAVTGEKDGMETVTKADPEGNERQVERMKIQQLDISKLIPLLTAALLQAQERIETLEARLIKLEPAKEAK